MSKYGLSRGMPPYFKVKEFLAISQPVPQKEDNDKTPARPPNLKKANAMAKKLWESD